MANRAYLYFQDNRERFDLNRNAVDYLDSRHSVPWAWMLFFGPQDLVLQPSGQGWDDIFLVTEWEKAQARFEKRIQPLLDYFKDRINWEQLQTFLLVLESRKEAFLVLDPYEMDHLENPVQWQKILKVLASQSETQLQFDKLSEFCGLGWSRNEDRFFLQVFGAWYD